MFYARLYAFISRKAVWINSFYNDEESYVISLFKLLRITNSNDAMKCLLIDATDEQKSDILLSEPCMHQIKHSIENNSVYIDFISGLSLSKNQEDEFKSQLRTDWLLIQNMTKSYNFDKLKRLAKYCCHSELELIEMRILVINIFRNDFNPYLCYKERIEDDYYCGF